MTAKSLPAHGTYARGNGAPGYREPCPCRPCHRAMRRGRKQYVVNRQLGRPGLIDATPARRHLDQLNATMTWLQIAEATGCHVDNLRHIASGRRAQIRRGTLNQILAVQAEAPVPGKYVDATGTRRRLQALRAIGHSSKAVAAVAGTTTARLQLISTGAQPTVRQRLAEKVAKAFVALHQTAAPAGAGTTIARRYAMKHGWAPPGAWDDIDDPNAVPDWTGHCGTDRGWWAHSVNNIPVCPPCQAAHEQWKDEHAHLEHDAYWGELGRARGAASNRGVALATDARELMRVCGLSTEQAAERLGITRNHLQQTLLRHPADEVVDVVVDEDDLAVAA
ncbi:hypothetical protein OG601_47045 [Streptomyces sp. NBC_01239]|uniref:hypothetical protein n=1 Tax=Streptomyces sp. NBC_01239 TaxID=2903792 RepID=UPI00224EA38F|nr:hypothetical protein [Streptomyces sp. NBC_01239]MCX4809051.1 hypothetical protein [Streptomyces sp. NBC_01239]MCX4818132.1 hypothetical protein [Streptomyces sp. NBC_01239]